MTKIAMLILLSTLLLPYQTEENKIEMQDTAKATKQEIMKKIPVGSSLEEAQKVMEANGFTCKRQENAFFSEQDNNEKPTIHKNIDYLYCDKERPANQYCVRRWQVAIVHNQGVVTEILVSTGLICV